MQQSNQPLLREITLNNHFRTRCSLEAKATGLFVTVEFSNVPLPQGTSAPVVEIWYPIVGHIEYIERTPELRRIQMDHLYELGGNSISQVLDLKLDSEKESGPIQFYANVTLSQAERMLELADQEGTVTLKVHLYFSILYEAGALGQKTYGYHPVFSFDITKLQMQDWMTEWTSWHTQSQDLPASVPREVLNDYREALSAFKVNAFKASVTMCRRTLQQALEDKGATPELELVNQIDQLVRKKLLSSATASLAHGVREFGNFGAHPKKDLLAQVTSDEAKIALEVTKKILKELYK